MNEFAEDSRGHKHGPRLRSLAEHAELAATLVVAIVSFYEVSCPQARDRRELSRQASARLFRYLAVKPRPVHRGCPQARQSFNMKAAP